MSYTDRIVSTVVHFMSFKLILFTLNIVTTVLYFNYSLLDLQRVSAVRPCRDAPDIYASSVPTSFLTSCQSFSFPLHIIYHKFFTPVKFCQCFLLHIQNILTFKSCKKIDNTCSTSVTADKKHMAATKAT